MLRKNGDGHNPGSQSQGRTEHEVAEPHMGGTGNYIDDGIGGDGKHPKGGDGEKILPDKQLTQAIEPAPGDPADSGTSQCAADTVHEHRACKAAPEGIDNTAERFKDDGGGTDQYRYREYDQAADEVGGNDNERCRR